MATAESKILKEPAVSATAARWYKDAIIYQIHVRAFRDSNGDGIGDLRGLTERLDYIQDLGVTAIWILPCFPSPLKDDGYDIADYMNINPEYGTLDDFRHFLDEAHERELRVISELVMNHTSDQHAWFQRSRRAEPGSRWRDWYVWSDTPEKYQEARIIFQDFETSNWSWDPVAGAYFWHRFYNHQPDLNFDNPEVREAMFGVVDYWLETGVDGLRLDAVPYLFEREGTNGENLPETHAFLRELRSRVDAKHPDKMLLAEANQWPEDAAAYFGDGDECHMNFHFPLMPRLYVAVEREESFPLVDILEQTPSIAESCQWAIFLRNHDELTLEMVTDEERDYMYRTYALDSKMRINLGIRRRLAPLMSNDRRKIELMNALLMSLPGTPIIYYGDEIGMGDNYYLGDRNGVRTPMQWNADRNAGFSSAHPHSLYLPVIIDPEYHYEFRNVEMEHLNSQSLLWWTRRILDLRKQYTSFGQGTFEAINAKNPKVFAFIREIDSEILLIVANLSRFSQSTELELSKFQSRTPTELFGHCPFPVIGKDPYPVTLGPYGFYWFSIGSQDQVAAEDSFNVPVCRSSGRFPDLLKGQSRRVLRDALPPFLRRQRWYAGKSRRLQSLDIVDSFSLEPSQTEESLDCLVVRTTYSEGEPDTYVIPVMLVKEDVAEELLAEHPHAAILRVDTLENESDVMLCEATWNGHFWLQFLNLVADERKVQGVHATLAGVRTKAFDELWDPAVVETPPAVHGGQQSNTSTMFGDRFIFKLLRRITPGTNPDFEIGKQLTETTDISHVPRVAGAIECRTHSGRNLTIAILHEFIANLGDAWTNTLDELGRYFELVQSRTVDAEGPASRTDQELTPPSEPAPNANDAESQVFYYPSTLDELLESEPTPLAQETIGGFLHWAELLGRRLGELHVALSEIPDDQDFSPEPFTRLYQRGLYQSMRNQTRSTTVLLRSQLDQLDSDARQLADEVLELEQRLLLRFGDLLSDRIDAQRIRCHGDFHLGQVLFTGKDFVIIDFEGEPERPVSERRIKASPLRDVAGMIRSLHYVSHAALRGQTISRLAEHESEWNERWATFWFGWTSNSFLRGYLDAAGKDTFLPGNHVQLKTLLTTFLLEKALYELRYELNNRPDWSAIPLEGILQLVR